MEWSTWSGEGLSEDRPSPVFDQWKPIVRIDPDTPSAEVETLLGDPPSKGKTGLGRHHTEELCKMSPATGEAAKEIHSKAGGI